MADYFANVKKYAPEADEAVVKKIVNHLGIALKNRDSATVATSDPAEVGRVKDGFCTKKLELSPEDADTAIAKVTEIMKESNSKCRVAFYYLLARETNNLERFQPKS